MLIFKMVATTINKINTQSICSLGAPVPGLDTEVFHWIY